MKKLEYYHLGVWHECSEGTYLKMINNNHYGRIDGVLQRVNNDYRPGGKNYDMPEEVVKEQYADFMRGTTMREGHCPVCNDVFLDEPLKHGLYMYCVNGHGVNARIQTSFVYRKSTPAPEEKQLPDDYYVVNDTMLVIPAQDKKEEEPQTKAGLYLPPKIQISYTQEVDRKPPEILRGYVVRKGNGYPIGADNDMMGERKTVYIPLQVELGDEVYFQRSPHMLEIDILGTAYYLIRQGMVLLAKSNQIE